MQGQEERTRVVCWMSPVACSGLLVRKWVGPSAILVLGRKGRRYTPPTNPAVEFRLQLPWVPQIQDQLGFSSDTQGRSPTIPIKRRSGIGEWSRSLCWDSVAGHLSMLGAHWASREGLEDRMPPLACASTLLAPSQWDSFLGFAWATHSRVVNTRLLKSPDVGESEP